MTAGKNRPPGAVRRLLGILLPGSRGMEALEDLDRAYATLRDRYSRPLASAWYVLHLFRPDTWLLALVLRRIQQAETCAGEKEHRRRRRRGVIPWLEIRLAVRMLGRYPGLAFMAVSAMAVGVTAVVGVFSLTSNFLDPTLPLPEGDRLVGLQNWNVATSSAEPSSLRDLETWTAALQSVGEIGAGHLFERNLISGDAPGEPVRGAEVTPSTFRLARVPPLLGRPLVESDNRSGSRDVAVIGYDLWQRTFAGDPLVLGRRIEVGGSSYVVVGVMPEGFGFPVSQSLWIPLRTDVAPGKGLGSPTLLVFGRLRRGISLAQAQAEMSVAGNRHRGETDRASAALRPRVVPYVQIVQAFPDAMLIGARLSLLMLLLVVCANVGALVFARNLTREGEIAIRMSLGASRRRVMLQLFLESLALAGLASLVALVASSLALKWGRTLLMAGSGGTGSVPFWWRLALSSTTVMWVAVLTVLNAGICGLLPALPLTSRRLGPRLQRSGAGTSSLGFGRTVKTAMATQVALSVAFLTLTLGTWQRLDLGQSGLEGLAANQYLTAELRPATRAGSEKGSSDLPSRFESDRHALAERLASDPRVAGVAFADRLPGDDRNDMLVQVEGGPVFELPTVHVASVDARYFEILNRPLLAGRVFDGNDVAPDGTARPVVVVGLSFARRWLGGRHAVGRRLRFIRAHDVPGPWFEVVGVVGRPGSEEAHAPDGLPSLYRPLTGAPSVRVLVRAGQEPARLAATLRARAAEVDPTLRVTRISPLNVVLAADRARQRFVFAALLLATFMAMLLALGGVYAVMSFFVSRRTREIGIRAALGAGSARLTLGIFSAAAHQLGIGLLFGLAMAIPLSSWALEVGSVGVALDVSGVLVVAGLVACIGPTRQMLGVQPTEAMRADA